MKRLSGIAYSWQAEFGNNFAGRRILVTGATGFIGWHLCSSLVALDAEVHGLSRSADAAKMAPGCQAWAVNLSDIKAVRSAIAHIQPQLIYHLAGLVTARQELDLVLPMLENNLVGTVHLLQAVAETGGSPIVVASSSEELSATSLDRTPNSPYATAKTAGTMYARMFHKVYNLPVTVAQLFMSYGPRQASTKLIPYAIGAFLRGENPQLSSGDRVCDFVYVGDIVRGLLKAGIYPNLSGQTVALGTGKGTRIREVIELIAELLGSPIKPEFGAMRDRIGEQPQVADITTWQMLDWQPLWQLQDGLIETLAWYRKHEENQNGTS